MQYYKGDIKMSCFAMHHIGGSEKYEDRENDRDLIPAASTWQNPDIQSRLYLTLDQITA